MRWARELRPAQRQESDHSGSWCDDLVPNLRSLVGLVNAHIKMEDSNAYSYSFPCIFTVVSFSFKYV